MKVLIVRFAAIGDCVMTAWAVTAIRNLLPDAEIVWSVQDKCAPVIDTDRLVNSVHLVPRDEWKRHRWRPAVWREQFLCYTALRKSGFDVGFDFQGHSKTALMLRLSGCKCRYASRATDALAARLNPPRATTPKGPHEVDLAMALVRVAFDVQDVERPVMPLAPPVEEVVTVQTGAGEQRKTYPPAKMAEVVEGLAAKGYRVTALGGPQDPHLETPLARDLVGASDLSRTVRTVASSRLHISADTGTGHVAAAYEVPVVSLFGPTDPDRFRPFTRNGIVLRSGVSTEAIHPDQVVEAAIGLLSRTKSAVPR